MEVSALKYSGGIGLHGRSPLLRLQSDERLVALIRRGNQAAFEMLVARYARGCSRSAGTCLARARTPRTSSRRCSRPRTTRSSPTSATINVRPWLYRIARNRSLNHLRTDPARSASTRWTSTSPSYGASTADKVHDREEFRLLLERHPRAARDPADSARPARDGRALLRADRRGDGDHRPERQVAARARASLACGGCRGPPAHLRRGPRGARRGRRGTPAQDQRHLSAATFGPASAAPGSRHSSRAPTRRSRQSCRSGRWCC